MYHICASEGQAQFLSRQKSNRAPLPLILGYAGLSQHMHEFLIELADAILGAVRRVQKRKEATAPSRSSRMLLKVMEVSRGAAGARGRAAPPGIDESGWRENGGPC